MGKRCNQLEISQAKALPIRKGRMDLRQHGDAVSGSLHAWVVTKVRLGRFSPRATRNVGRSILLKALEVAGTVAILVAVTLALATWIVGGTVTHRLAILQRDGCIIIATSVSHQVLFLLKNWRSHNWRRHKYIRVDAIVLVCSGKLFIK